MTEYDAVDLYAGPGGWDVAAQRLGLNVLGIEWDKAACETRRAAGLPTVEGDVRDCDPSMFGAAGLIASPPCQTFSLAGKGAGRAALDEVIRLAHEIVRTGKPVAPDACGDERTTLVLEPLWWIVHAISLGAPYEWVAMEQVPTALPVWEVYAELMRDMGYSVDTGYLHAEQYGVPQTRKRAVLVAHLWRDARLPRPTHSRYHTRTPDRLDPGVLPWVSMGGAGVGWAGAAQESNYSGGPTDPLTGKRGRGIRPIGAPSSTITGKAPRWAGERRFTTQEMAQLQSFPREYPWAGGGGEIRRQIGNAVPPLLAEHVLRCVALTEREEISSE